MPTLDWIGKHAVLAHHTEIPYRLLKCNGKLSVDESMTKKDKALAEQDQALAEKDRMIADLKRHLSRA